MIISGRPVFQIPCVEAGHLGSQMKQDTGKENLADGSPLWKEPLDNHKRCYITYTYREAFNSHLLLIG